MMGDFIHKYRTRWNFRVFISPSDFFAKFENMSTDIDVIVTGGYSGWRIVPRLLKGYVRIYHFKEFATLGDRL